MANATKQQQQYNDTILRLRVSPFFFRCFFSVFIAMFLFSCILLLTRNRFSTQIHTHTNSHTHTVTVCLTAISCDFKIVIKFYVHIHTHIHFKSTFLPLYFSFVLPTTAFSFSLLVKYIILCASPSSVCPLLYFTHQPFHNNSNICAV